MFRPNGSRRSTAGFTLIEVLVALAVVAISLAAIGSLIAVTTRGARTERIRHAVAHLVHGVMRLVAMQGPVTRRIGDEFQVPGLPDRHQLVPGNFSGEAAGHRWRVDVMPFYADFVDSQQPTNWIPQTVVVRVQSPAGKVLQVNTVRLRRRPAQ